MLHQFHPSRTMVLVYNDAGQRLKPRKIMSFHHQINWQYFSNFSLLDVHCLKKERERERERERKREKKQVSEIDQDIQTATNN